MNEITFESFDLIIDSIGRFKRNSGDLWWAGVKESNTLFNLHQNLISGLLKYDFECDTRKYSPHITLGREIITKTQPRHIESFGETVTKIELMKSEHIGGKLIYTAIHANEKGS